MDTAIDITADLNAQDDDGLSWSTLADAIDPSRVVPGAMLLAGNEAATAVVRVAVDDDGQVHFTVLPGSVEESPSPGERIRLRRGLASETGVAAPSLSDVSNARKHPKELGFLDDLQGMPIVD